MHIAIAQAIHAVSKSKKLITIFNRFAISISYDEVLRIDTAVAKRTIALSTPGCIVPINPSIRPNIHINGAIDNFDLEENSKSGTNGSHDTVLILMQSIPKSVHFEKQNLISTVIPEHGRKEKKLSTLLDCQKQMKVGILKKNYLLPECFRPNVYCLEKRLIKTSNNNYLLWNLGRHKARSLVPDNSLVQDHDYTLDEYMVLMLALYFHHILQLKVPWSNLVMLVFTLLPLFLLPFFHTLQ